MEYEPVQAIASLSLDTIPSTFIFTDDEQPPVIATADSGDSQEIPVIDLNGDPDIVRTISEASREWGIFQLVNHGIPDDVISEMQRAGKEFFDLPLEEKLLVADDPNSDSVEGYGSQFKMEVRGKRGWVDHVFHYISPPSAINYKFWPKNPPFYREANEEYGKRIHEVAGKVFECLSLDLGLEPQAVIEAVGGDELMYLMKINYYPTCPRPELTHGVGAHTDMCAITILVHDVSGLQVFQNERWFDVKCIPNALVVFLGEQVEVLSNGKYKSALHRSTVSKDKIRMSWPVFVQPPPEQEIGPIPVLINEENPAKYTASKYKDYAFSRLNLIKKGL